MLLLEYRKHIIGAVCLLTCLALYNATKVYFYHDLDRFLPKELNDHQFLKHFQAELEPDDSYYLIAAKNHNGIFEQDFLFKLDSLTKSCNKLEHILNTVSISNLSNPLKTPFGLVNVPVIHIDQPEKYLKDSINIFSDERILERFVSKDGKTAMVAMQTASPLTQGEAESLHAAAKALGASFSFDEMHTIGKAYIQTEFVRLIQSELFFYIILCNIFLILVIYFIFRRFWTVFIALNSVVLGAVFFAGLLGFFQIPLDLMSMLFPPLMLIVGMSDVIHFLSKYMDELRAGKERLPAMAETIREIGWATFLTSSTTAVGFSALYFSKIEPIQTFGIIAAVGVFIAYLTVLFFTTCVLVYFTPAQILSKDRVSEFFESITHRNYFFVQNNTKLILFTSAICMLLCFWGISKISTNAFVLSDVPDKSELMDEVRFFDEHLSGIRSFELAIIPKEQYLVDDFEVIQEIEKLEQHLKTSTTVKSILSPSGVYKSMNRANSSNNAKAYRLPSDPKKFKKYKRQLSKVAPGKFNKVISEDKKLGRLTGRMVDLGSERIKEINQGVTDWIDSNIDASIVEFRPTGTALVIDKNNDYLRESLAQSLVFALLMVSLMMAFLFKDIRLVIISLIPNVIPLFIAAALLGFVGIELKASTSIIFAIAFGIAVDDTIHFLSKFKIERSKGVPIRLSIYNTFMETGKAIYLTTVILFFGFCLLIFSNFNGVYYVGFLISFTLLAALLSCLTLLPVCLTWILGGFKEEKLKEEDFKY